MKTLYLVGVTIFSIFFLIFFFIYLGAMNSPPYNKDTITLFDFLKSGCLIGVAINAVKYNIAENKTTIKRQ